MRQFERTVALCALVCAASLLLGSARAGAQEEEGTPQTDPSARVARLSFQYGSVSLQPGGEDQWVEAVPNRPLTSGDSLWVDAGGRAELHVGSTAIRLGASTGITLLEVSDRVVQIRLAQGSVIVGTRHVDDDDVLEVDTPNLAFTVLAPGEYRLDVNADGTETSAAVWHGQGRVTGGGRDYTVVAGQQAHFSGLDELSYEISPVPAADPFDRWAADRDRREDRADTANYVSREMTGYEDLDSYGNWSVIAAYGPVWRPVGVPVGWAPYRYGHWVWIAPWGWTWVDDQPWGFAPFHYGRWAYIGTGWVWVPGPVVVRPVYAPALVAFVGGGAGGGFALTAGGGPGVAWFPLGPGEVFVPGYRVSRVYVTQINVTNTRVGVERVTTVYNAYRGPGGREGAQITYVNRRAPGGVTAVSRETFVSARPVGRNVVAVNSEEISRAPVQHGASFTPERASVIGAGGATHSAPPAEVQHRMVRSNRMPSAAPSYSQRPASANPNPNRQSAPPTAAPSSTAPPTPPARNPSSEQPARAPRTIERVEPPPPGPAPAPQATAPQSPAPAHPNVQLNPPPKPKTQEETREEDRKYQHYQQQQQQQQQHQQQPQQKSSSKSEKGSQKEKEKDKPNKP